MHNSSQLLTLHPCNFHWFDDLMAQICVVLLDTDCLTRGNVENELAFAGPVTIHGVEEISELSWMVYRNCSSNRKVLLFVACISCPPLS